MIYGVTYSNQRVSAADHAKLFRMVIGDGVMNGCGCSYRYDKFTISAGQFIACGRLTGIEGSEVIDITGNSGYARIRGIIDMDQVAEIDSFGQFYWRVDYASSADGFAALTQEDVNASGKIYEIEWAVVSLGEGGITGVIRSIANAEGGGGGSGDPSFIGENDYEFSGAAADIIYYSAGNDTDWEIAVLGNGQFKFKKNPGLIEVFAVGAGNPGGSISQENSAYIGAPGGNGGEVLYYDNVTVSRNNPYAITIGQNGGDTIISGLDITARGGQGLQGATPARAGSGSTDGSPGTSGELAFNGDDSAISSIQGTLYGSSGGSGSAKSTNGGSLIERYGGQPGWTSTDHTTYPRSSYGTGGGLPTPTPKAGRANTGQGGGGDSNIDGSSGTGSGSAAGGSGIIIIRNHRTTPAA